MPCYKGTIYFGDKVKVKVFQPKHGYLPHLAEIVSFPVFHTTATSNTEKQRMEL